MFFGGKWQKTHYWIYSDYGKERDSSCEKMEEQMFFIHLRIPRVTILSNLAYIVGLILNSTSHSNQHEGCV